MLQIRTGAGESVGAAFVTRIRLKPVPTALAYARQCRLQLSDDFQRDERIFDLRSAQDWLVLSLSQARQPDVAPEIVET